MPIRGLHHVNLRGVPAQVREMRDLYCNVLGLTEGPRPPFLSTGAWLYAGELPLVHLVEDVSGPSHANRMDVLAVDHVAFACQGFDEMRGRLEARGVAYTVTHVPMTGAPQINLRDPSGMKVELAFSPDDQEPWCAGDAGEQELLQRRVR
jgi:catechol 2,3-dioxygenase-like lactoylglutathione lyase family enzyme